MGRTILLDSTTGRRQTVARHRRVPLPVPAAFKLKFSHAEIPELADPSAPLPLEALWTCYLTLLPTVTTAGCFSPPPPPSPGALRRGVAPGPAVAPRAEHKFELARWPVTARCDPSLLPPSGRLTRKPLARHCDKPSLSVGVLDKR